MQFYNTYTNSKEVFIPLENGKVKIYVCGPTVYDYIHIGNARPFIIFDILRRFLKYRGYEVTYILNLTDIDDRIIERSKTEGVDFNVITEKYIKAFFEDANALGVQRADGHPKATDHIRDIIEIIKKLMDEGVAYQVNGNVFYDVSKFHRYGRLSGKKIDDLNAGARVSVDEKKHDPLDFALWKSKKSGEPAWESPWGLGRPGWHIECSAMSMKYLGNNFDIHAGGIDLVFPHHENEIAQSEEATKEKFVNFWLHNGFLRIEGEKMAKSLGNFRTVREALKNYPGTVFRMFFLQKHYRSPIDFTFESLEAAKRATIRLRIFFDNLIRVLKDFHISDTTIDKEKISKAYLQFLDYFEKLKLELIEAMEDDFNTPVALSKLFDMVRETNKVLSKSEMKESEKYVLTLVKKELESINSFFGIVDLNETKLDSEKVHNLLSLLIDVRNELRAKKEWKLADKIRDELKQMEILLEDRGGKTDWRYS